LHEPNSTLPTYFLSQTTKNQFKKEKENEINKTDSKSLGFFFFFLKKKIPKLSCWGGLVEQKILPPQKEGGRKIGDLLEVLGRFVEHLYPP